MVALGFYLLSLVIFFSLFYLLKKYSEGNKLLKYYVIGFITWLIYLLVISNLGLLDFFGLPPRVPLLVILPAILISVIVTGRPVFRSIFLRLPLSYAIYVQSFRIFVELLIYGAFLMGVFPEAVTFEGTNFDILVGTSALLVAFLAQKDILAKRSLLLWNILSLCILTLTGYTFISTYYLGETVSQEQALLFVRLPYLLLPGVLLPYAIFYHVFSIRQLIAKN